MWARGPAPSERTRPQIPERPHPTLGSRDTPRAGPASPCGFLASCAPLSKVLNQAPHTLFHSHDVCVLGNIQQIPVWKDLCL